MTDTVSQAIMEFRKTVDLFYGSDSTELWSDEDIAIKAVNNWRKEIEESYEHV